MGFREQHEAFRERGVAVLGISPDDVESHRQFAEQNDLPFTLLADTNAETIKKYGAWGERVRDGNVTMGVLRTTFVIDRNGIVQKVYQQVISDGHAAQVLADIDAMRSHG
ncbi:MAG TPA: peroxiredoxin [Chloroflexota bacterium]|nr:peroxiredoxin [Chloroflexota bacterium]